MPAFQEFMASGDAYKKPLNIISKEMNDIDEERE